MGFIKVSFSDFGLPANGFDPPRGKHFHFVENSSTKSVCGSEISMVLL